MYTIKKRNQRINNNGRRKPIYINCPRGFEIGPNGECIDIDECLRPFVCGKKGYFRCVNIPGAYRCETQRILCGNGFVTDPKTGRCIDIDECKERIHRCGPDQTCENRPGGYVCYCPPGKLITQDS